MKKPTPFGRKQIQAFVKSVREIIVARGAVRCDPKESHYEWKLKTKRNVLRLSFEEYFERNSIMQVYIHCQFDDPEKADVACSASGKWNHYAGKDNFMRVIESFRDDINDMTEEPK